VNVIVIVNNLVDHVGRVSANGQNVHAIVTELTLTLKMQTLQ
jgi:hypothetical protein